jgi:hypothetical protein
MEVDPPTTEPATSEITDLLANLARADGNHDFEGLGPKLDEPANPAFRSSVVGDPREDWNEDNALKDVCQRDMREFLRYNEPGPMPPLDSVTTRTGIEYPTIRIIPFENIKSGELVGSKLVDELFRDDSDVILQVDFNHHGFLTHLAGAKGENLTPTKTIGYMWSAATVNDPASKTDPTISIFTRGNHEVHLKPYYQKSGTTIFSGGATYDKSIPTNNFNTKYEVELSGLATKMIIGRKRKDTVTIKFTKVSNVATVNDSKAQNSIESLKPFVDKLLTKLRASGLPNTTLDKLQFELGTKWVQKRSGDWLQVLHAAMTHSLTLRDSPNDMNGAPISPTATPFFVTHDRVALAYALAMGVSSIYFFNKTSDKKDYIAVFDGRAQSKEKKEENERKRNEYCEGLYADITDIKGLWEWYSGPLLDARTTALNTQLEKVIGNPGRNDGLTAQLSGFLGRAREEERHRTELEKLLKDIFRAAMIHTSIEQLIPGDLKDPSTLVESDPCLAYETAKTLTKLKAQHGGDNFIPATVLDGRQIEKSKTYKTLAEWQIAASSVRYKNSGTESRYTIINRNAPPQNPEEVRDAFSFLAYIANSRSSALKNGIAEACHVLQQQIFASDPVDQAAKTEMYLNDMVGGPSVKARERIEVGLRDILTQTYLYLKCEPEDNPFIFGNVGRAEPGTVIDFIKQATKIRLFVPRQGDPYDSGGVLQRFYTGIKLLYSRFRSFIDHPPESDTTYGDTQGGGGKQTGGWGEGTQLTLTEDLDTRQTTDPGLHALIEAEVYSLLDDLALTRTQLEDVGVFGQGDPENLQPAGAGAGTGLGQSVTNASDVPQRLDLSASASTASMASSGASSPMSLDTASAGSAAFGQSASNASTASNEAMDEGRPSQGGGGRGDYLTSKGWTQQREGVWRDPATFLDYIEDIATGFQRARDGQTGGAVSKETLKPKLAI